MSTDGATDQNSDLRLASRAALKSLGVLAAIIVCLTQLTPDTADASKMAAFVAIALTGLFQLADVTATLHRLYASWRRDGAGSRTAGDRR